MKRVLYPLLFAFFLYSCLQLIFTGENPPQQPGSIPTAYKPTPPASGEEKEILRIQEAVFSEIAGRGDPEVSVQLFAPLLQDVRISEDSGWAAAKLVLTNPQTGEILPTEPGLALSMKKDGDWITTLPGDEQWNLFLAEIPGDLLSTEEKAFWLEVSQVQQVDAPTSALSGYLLPWEAGKTVHLSQSVGHDRYIPSGNAHYAFDFYVPQTMFNIYASKAGTVWLFADSVPNNDHSGVGNYLVLRDTTTEPTTYQLYLHLAQGSIPPSLRSVGAQVIQGQFIGLADNTGQSTGHHLHFQIQVPINNNPYSYWGKSVDVVFADVGINGGRPRRSDALYNDFPWCTWPGDVCVDAQSAYVSGNIVKGDLTPPTGDYLGVALGEVVSSEALILVGWASDGESGLYSAQFTAYHSGSWHTIGPVFYASPFVHEWNLCASDVPDGPVSLAIRLYDRDGNWNSLAGLRHFTKKFTCPLRQPACTPASNQVAIFKGTDFSGACTVFSIGEYPDGTSLGMLGNNAAASLLVGADVQATLYTGSGFQGRSQTVNRNDSHLGDNLVGVNSVSSLKVLPKTQFPGIPQPVWPANGETLDRYTSFTLYWRDAGGGLEYQVSLVGPSGTTTSGWLTTPYWQLGSGPGAVHLAPGTYTWQLQARNNAGATEWSTPGQSFTIATATTPVPVTVTAPYSDTMESASEQWSASGLWQWVSTPKPAHSGSHSWWFGESVDGDERYFSEKRGSLTSAPIAIPASPAYYLRFWYRYQTESSGQYWDQRWLQISAGNGPFVNVLQLSDDPMNVWLRSPAVDLSAYAGQTIRLRFYFDTIDPSFTSPDNDYEGWYIDDVDISTRQPASCSDPNEPNHTPDQATLLHYNLTHVTMAEICPGGDVDFYRFEGFAGDRVVVDIEAQSIGSRLDPYLFLLDSDGVSLLAEHDDEVYAVLLDPHLGYRLPRTGAYYLKLRAWNHPSVGGGDYRYTFRLFKDEEYPSLSLISPQTGAYLPSGEFAITASASDAVSGISQVEFLWHGGNWLDGNWQLLGVDRDGMDGWQFQFNPASFTDQEGAAIYVRAVDWAGNVSGDAAWNLGIDRTAPLTTLQPLVVAQTSTAFLLSWTGVDHGSGVAYYDIQRKVDEGNWQDYLTGIPWHKNQVWVVGEAGRRYAFRMRGSDRAGNTGSYPAAEQAFTTVPPLAELCSAPDVYEPDGSPALAKTYPLGLAGQVRNFCGLSPGFLNDEDWIKFQVVAGKRYYLQSLPLAPQTAAVLSLYAGDGVTLLLESFPPDFGRSNALEVIPQQNGWLYLRVRHVQGEVVGHNVSYLLQIQEGYHLYLPWVAQKAR